MGDRRPNRARGSHLQHRVAGNRELLPRAVAHQSSCRRRVRCDIDLPGRRAAKRRDGPHEREQVHRVIADVVAAVGS